MVSLGENSSFKILELPSLLIVTGVPTICVATAKKIEVTRRLAGLGSQSR